MKKYKHSYPYGWNCRNCDRYIKGKEVSQKILKKREDAQTGAENDTYSTAVASVYTTYVTMAFPALHQIHINAIKICSSIFANNFRNQE